MPEKNEFFTYRGYPLVRKGNQLYYGRMSQPSVVMLEIQHTTKLENGLEIADKLNVYQIRTSEPNPVKAIVRKAERGTLYDSLGLAYAWLKRDETG